MFWFQQKLCGLRRPERQLEVPSIIRIRSSAIGQTLPSCLWCGVPRCLFHHGRHKATKGGIYISSISMSSVAEDGKNHFESICGSGTGEEYPRSLLSKFECICWQGRAYNSGAVHVHTMAIASGGRSYGRKGESTPDSIMLLCHQDGSRPVRLNLTLSHHRFECSVRATVARP